jgi:hypothetical protein
MKRLFGFLHALHMAVYELWLNGGDPVIRARPFALPPDPMPSDYYMVGEKAYRLAQDVMLSMMPEITRRNEFVQHSWRQFFESIGAAR